MKLVFIHGSGGTGLNWKYQLRRFPDALAVTLPGRPDGAACESIEAATAWLRGELQEREDLVLVGHSLGGGIALQYALDHPGELAGIVLVGSGARLRVHPATLEAVERAVGRSGRFTGMFEEAWKRIPGELGTELVQQSADLGPEPFLADLKACDRFDVMDRVGGIQVPTLAIVGTDDVMTPPKYSEYLRDHMPDARVAIIEGGTHFVFAEQPDAVNDAIAGFVEKLAG